MADFTAKEKIDAVRGTLHAMRREYHHVHVVCGHDGGDRMSRKIAIFEAIVTDYEKGDAHG